MKPTEGTEKGSLVKLEFSYDFLVLVRSGWRGGHPATPKRQQEHISTQCRARAILNKRSDGMQESTDQFKDMVDKIPTLAWSCRPDGTTEFLNQRWLDYTGLALEEALGWGWKLAIHSEDVEKLVNTWQSILKSGEAGEEEARLRRFDGEYRWFLFRAVPVVDGQGESCPMVWNQYRH